MNHTLIVRRAFDLVKRYRVLWLLGILVAIASGFGRGGGGRGNFTFGPEAPFPQLGRGDLAALAGVFVALACLMVILGLIAVVVGYVSKAALFRSVEQIEESGHAPGFREGFKLGWNWRAFRLFLLDLIIGIPAAVVSLLLILVALSPLLLLMVDNEAVRVVSVLLTVGLALMVMLVIIVLASLLSLFMRFIRRAAVLDDLGVIDSIRHGVALVRSLLRDAGIMWVIMLGVSLGYGIVMIPVFGLLAALAALLGGGPAWLIYTATQSIPAAALIGAPIVLLVLIVPLAIISGFYQAFQSSVWTLTYREVRALAQ